MIKVSISPSCSPPPLSAFLDSAKTRPTKMEMERRRKELKIIVTTGLGGDVDRYVSQSPTLIKQIVKIKSKRWRIVWGPAGKGSQKIQQDDKRRNVQLILIDSQFNTSQSQDIAYVTSTIAHEVGHVFFYKMINVSSYKKCMESLMVGGGSEADAVVNQILIRNEILKEACIDIFEEGNEYDFMKNDFVSFYNEGIIKKDMQIAKRKIAEIYVKQKTSTSNPPKTYEDSYGDYCKENVR